MPLLQRTTGDNKIFEEYKMEATIQSKMRLKKCDAYTAKEIRGYRRRKSYVSAAREEKQKIKQIYRQITGAPPIRRRDEPMN